ncbi:MAG: hypothetical protein KDD82_22570 [Planctomycetes bacterium]|nr:hypothetical protein [Planctomycetota bacterium]
MSDQNQILRLLGTIREESAATRSRQEELFELLISYKDQIEDLKQTVLEKLAGLPKSPYIAGQLVPAPDKIDGTDDFRQLLATYLHGPQPTDEDDGGPLDVEMPPPRAVDPSEVQLESEGRSTSRGEGRSEGRSGSRGRSGGRGRSSSGGPRDSDLERGPDRDVEPFDLQEPEKGGKKKAKRRRRRKKTSAEHETVADD